MRIFIDLIEGSVSSEFPVKGDGRQAVKALAGERVEVRWLNEGVGYEMPTSASLKFVVREQKGGALLAELTDFTAPADVITGYYTGRLSFNTDTVVALLAANPTKSTFAAVGEMLWRLDGETDWECSDDITFVLLRKVSAGDDEGDPLVLASGFQWLQNHLVAGTNVTLTVDGGGISISVPDFANGTDGREIELQVTSTHIQWRYVGGSTWTNLVALTTITGPAGTNGTNGEPGAPGTNGTVGADGNDGREIELQVTSTHIQWRYVGGSTWTNLVALTTITGPAGPAGEDAAAVSLVRGSGLLQGHTSAGSDAGPAHVNLGTNSSYFESGDTLHLIITGICDVMFEFTNGSPPITEEATDVSLTGIEWDLAAQFTALIAAITGTGYATAAYNSGDSSWVVTTNATGAAISLSHDYQAPGEGGPIPTGNYSASGTDATAPSGAISEVELIAQDGTKTIKPVRIMSNGATVSAEIQIALKVGDTYYPVTDNIGSGSGSTEPGLGDYHAEWITGRASAALVARMIDSPPVGGSKRITVIVEQN